MRALPVLLSTFALGLAHVVTAKAAAVTHPMITPAPVLEKLENRQSDDCDYSDVRDCEETKWSILFRAPICRSASDRGICSCSAAEAQSACYVAYCQTAPENVSSKVESECASVSRSSGSTSRTTSRPTSRTTSATGTATTSSSAGGDRLSNVLNSRLLLALGGLLAIEI